VTILEKFSAASHGPQVDPLTQFTKMTA